MKDRFVSSFSVYLLKNISNHVYVMHVRKNYVNRHFWSSVSLFFKFVFWFVMKTMCVTVSPVSRNTFYYNTLYKSSKT